MITENSKVRLIKIFNIASLTSGDISKIGGAEPFKPYVRDPNATTTFGNISQTLYLWIPN
jgi:hypothetical protein